MQWRRHVQPKSCAIPTPFRAPSGGVCNGEADTTYLGHARLGPQHPSSEICVFCAPKNRVFWPNSNPTQFFYKIRLSHTRIFSSPRPKLDFKSIFCSGCYLLLSILWDILLVAKPFWFPGRFFFSFSSFFPPFCGEFTWLAFSKAINRKYHSPFVASRFGQKFDVQYFLPTKNEAQMCSHSSSFLGGTELMR